MESTITEIDLLEGLRKQELIAYEQLYQKAMPIVFGVIGKNYQGRAFKDDALDLLQDTIMKLDAKIKAGQSIYFLDGFIIDIARKLWANEQKKRSRFYNLLERFKLRQQKEMIEEDAYLEKQVHRIRVYLNKFGDGCKEIITLFYDLQKSTADIADYFGITPQAARKRLFDCRQKIKKALNHE